MRKTALRFPELPGWVLVLALAAAVGLVAQSLRLGYQVVHRLDNLSTAATDNMQWSLSQAEVEHLKLVQAAEAAEELPALAHLRRQFDLYYSRIATFRDSPLFADLRGTGPGAALLDRLQGRLDAMTGWIDGPDAALLAAVPQIRGVLEENSGDVRELALLGVVLQSDMQLSKRLELMALLSRLGWVVLALVLALALTALTLGGLYRAGRRLAAARTRTAKRMEAMVASSLDAVLLAGADGRIREFNGAAEAIFGYTSAEAKGRALADLIVPDHLRDAHLEGLRRFARSGKSRVAGKGRIRLEARRKSGEVFPVEMSLAISRSERDTVFISFLRDISDRIAAEEELRRARDDALAGERAKANLLTVMSHEMRTPLTGVLGAIDLLEATGPSADQQRYLQAMRVSGELLLHHVNDVLELSRLEAGRDAETPRVFDLAALVSDLVESQQATAKINGNTLSLHCSLGGTPYVSGQPRAVQQALLNLIGNALKFTREGAVSVDVERLPGSDMVELHVADTGKGIPAADLERIFEDFTMLDASYRRGSEGTGLGLAITRRLVQAMGGEIRCESEVGEGSLFTITLPIPAADADLAAPQEEETSAAEQGAGPRRLLIAEDNDINRELLAQMLSGQGHTVTAVPGGAEAVEAASKEAFDLIITDISMPGVDGIEALRRIRTRNLAEGIEVVALTAHAAAEDHARILEAGFAEVLTKPVSPAALADLVARRARKSSAAPPPAPAAAAAKQEAEAQQSDIHQFFDALGRDRARGFLIDFCEDVRRLSGGLQEADRLSDGQRKEAHRLAGSAAVLGLTGLRAAMLDIETAEEGSTPPQDVLAQSWREAEQVLAPHLRG
ncbi:ATP-binding protein [Cribrihabitans neustonicus]|uniref:PAS domain-containing hybrid sensor histidine kinase/response regulator n=1 Tax=Cribrihabitans neustonicus TaxID=1429085 RepID=UPI003B5A639E